MKNVNSQAGFTLVELMVVVAIIGVLSAVAIPNFKRYNAKSKHVEAKVQLTSIYQVETTIQQDWEAYATCLGAAGYSSPAATASNYFAVGFSAAETLRARGNGFTACDNNSARAFNGSKTVGGRVRLAANLAGYTIPAAGNTFSAGAEGYIDADYASLNANNYARFTINQNKDLAMTKDGFTN